ncbi:MAG TPA: biotin carboxylase N-terminal domain-containing protein [Candidatus Limnocylindrales bacterium]
MRKDVEGETPFSRLLVANRGEIALRIIRACREMGISTVAVFSDADEKSAHVRAADEAIRLGPAPATESYLRADRIIDAAISTGAEAIHPGYGFLAERASFAADVAAAGLAFIGPEAATIASLGDKLAARRLAEQAGVPIVPGTLEAADVTAADRVAAIEAEAEQIGFPLLVKAASGGGGRGMRRVDTARELPAALAAGSAEALAAFGDGSVYIERIVEPARHIEVQLIADRAGSVVALGERDCSIQRRHQKLIEESPAPGLSDDERRDLHAMAVRLAAAAELENASTAEFLFDADRRFWFLEVNTRLQVEHGVTELVTDVDLVREQIRIAAGLPLSAATVAAAAQAARPGRHAIEVRLSAEDPARGFAPAPGRIGMWRMPGGPGVRVDAAIEEGDRVPADYDPLIAKVMVVGPDRAAAIDRLRRALGEVEVTGVQTTLPFHRFVASAASFRTADLSTGWVASAWDPHVRELRDKALHEAAATAAAVARGEVSARDVTHVLAPGPGSGPAAAERSPWRSSGRSRAIRRWPR